MRRFDEFALWQNPMVHYQLSFSFPPSIMGKKIDGIGRSANHYRRLNFGIRQGRSVKP